MPPIAKVSSTALLVLFSPAAVQKCPLVAGPPVVVVGFHSSWLSAARIANLPLLIRPPKIATPPSPRDAFMLFIYRCHHALGHNLSWPEPAVLLLKPHQDSVLFSLPLLPLFLPLAPLSSPLPPPLLPLPHARLFQPPPQKTSWTCLARHSLLNNLNPGRNHPPGRPFQHSRTARFRTVTPLPSPPSHRLLVRYKCHLHPPTFNRKAHPTSPWRSPSPRLKSRLPRPARLPAPMPQRLKCRCTVVRGQVRAPSLCLSPSRRRLAWT